MRSALTVPVVRLVCGAPFALYCIHMQLSLVRGVTRELPSSFECAGRFVENKKRRNARGNYSNSLTDSKGLTGVGIFDGVLHPPGLIAGFQRLALVVLFLTLTNGNAHLYVATLCQYFQGYDSPALLLGFNQVFNLPFFGQQLTATGLTAFIDDNTAGAIDGGVYQPQLAVLDRYVSAA